MRLTDETSDNAVAPLWPWEYVKQRTEALWPQVAEALRFPVEGVSFTRMSVSSRFEGRRCVLKVDVPGRGQFVLRAEYQDTRLERFQGVVDRQQQAATALAEVPGVAVPNVLWRHPEAPHVLMELCSGTPLIHELEYCDLGFGDRARVLERVGAAVRALHACSATGPRKLWPKTHLKGISDRAEKLRSGEVSMRRKSKFLGLCAYAHRAARRARGLEFEGYLAHGDLHRRNILVSETEVSFIDFSNFHSSIGHNDVVNLWLANCPAFLAEAGEVEGFGGISQDDLTAFERGYGFDFQSDPIFQFLFACRLVQLWQRLPPPEVEADAQELAREAGYLRIFNWLLAHEPG